MTEFSNVDDIIDVRDIIARVEELEKDQQETDADNDSYEEHEKLTDFLDELKGKGGDHDWRGDWYPSTLIHRAHFEDYAEELAKDIGAIDENAGWPLQYIDWGAAAKALESDYSSVEFDGQEYLYR